MEALVSKLLSSPHSASSKVALLKKLIGSKSKVFNPQTDADVQQWIQLTITLLLDERTDGGSLRFQVGSVMLERIGKLHPGFTKTFFSASILSSVAPTGLTSGKSQAAKVRFLLVVLRCLRDQCACSVVGLLERLRHLPACFNSLLVPNPPVVLPTLDTQWQLLQLWKEFPIVVPAPEVFRTDVLVRWLSLLPGAPPSHSGITAKQLAMMPTLLVDLICTRWTSGVEQAHSVKEAELTITTVFAFLACAPLLAEPDSKTTLVRPAPSSALCLLVSRLPVSLAATVPQFVCSITKSLRPDYLHTAATRLMTWPMTSTVSKWMLGVLDGLCMASKFDLLAKLTRESTSLLLPQLQDPKLRRGAVDVLYRLLIGYRVDSNVFHDALGPLKAFLEQAMELQDETKEHDSATSKSTSPAQLRPVLLKIGELLHVLMYLFTGYPDKYIPVIQLLQKMDISAPLENELQSLLRASSWSGWKQELNTSTLVVGASSERTGKVGLHNLGNTCYMNSVLQALFMTDSFRNRIWGWTEPQASNNKSRDSLFGRYKPSSVMRQLREVFAFLVLSERHAYSPSGLLTALPSEFRSGRQQDATEFSKFLLDLISTHGDLDKVDSKVSDTPRTPDAKRHKNASAAVMSADEFFGGQVRSTVTCTQCAYSSAKTESFSQLSLSSIPESQVTASRTTSTEQGHGARNLWDALRTLHGATVPSSSKNAAELTSLLEHYFAPELLVGDNAYLCPQCKTKQSATKTLCITKAPEHLFVCLKRYTFDWSTSVRAKSLTRVRHSGIQLLPVERDDGRTVLVPYVLYAVVLHSGSSTQHGHYYSVCRHSDAALDAVRKAKNTVAAIDDCENKDDSVVAGNAVATSADAPSSNGTSVESVVASVKWVADQAVENGATSGTWYMCNDSQVSQTSYATMSTIASVFPTDVAYALLYRRVLDEDINRGPNTSGSVPADLAQLVVQDNAQHQNSRMSSNKGTSGDQDIGKAISAGGLTRSTTEVYDEYADYDADFL